MESNRKVITIPTLILNVFEVVDSNCIQQICSQRLKLKIGIKCLINRV